MRETSNHYPTYEDQQEILAGAAFAHHGNCHYSSVLLTPAQEQMLEEKGWSHWTSSNE